MSKTFLSVLAVCLLLATMLVDTGSAQCTQGAARTAIVVTDNGSGRDTLWFGQDPAGSYGLNTPLCEIELPPPPPSGVFDVRWANIPGRDGLDTPGGLGQGFTEDYRAYTVPNDIDTFRVKFQPSEGGFPFTFTWSTAHILAMGDSAVLQDEFGGVIIKVRMHAVNIAVVPSPAFTSLILIRYGARPSEVEPVGSELPTSFELTQNYPNPFNPSTTIRFGVEHLAKTDVVVFDVLGRKVATLVSEELSPGFYNVNWDGRNDLGVAVSSGTYLLRMTAVDAQNQSFSSVRKLLLMK
ncbi:MAG: FlgD immunoglobulin-like domain containing protein [Bacteroidota bacterium]